jgi:hypothetical protein
MRVAAVALLLALAVVVSDSALARKGGGHVSGGVKFSGGHASGGKVYGGHVSHGHGHFNGHHHKSFGHHHGHHHHGAAFVGFGVGFAYPWSWYYPPPYYYPGYYYSQPVAYPAQPVTYVEQGAAPAPAEPAGWWYYCEASRTYYPYVKECPSGWQRVPALPPPPN